MQTVGGTIDASETMLPTFLTHYYHDAPFQSITDLPTGEMVRVMWRGSVVFVVRRGEDMLKRLPEMRDQLRDPDSLVEEQQPAYAANETRSVKPEILVVIGACTHLGCAPLPEFEVGPSPDWHGGFFCPCHGSKFDLAGRVFKGVPAPTNLVVPPYRFVRGDLIMIGVDSGEA